jgi:hypothetical protein
LKETARTVAFEEVKEQVPPSSSPNKEPVDFTRCPASTDLDASGVVIDIFD